MGPEGRKDAPSFKNMTVAGSSSCFQYSSTSFYLAVCSDNPQFIRHLVSECRVDVDTKFFPGDLPAVSVAIHGGHWNAFDELMSLGCSVSQTDDQGRTPLLIACEVDDAQDRIKCVRRLLKERALPNVQDRVLGWSPLHRCVSRFDMELLDLLLSSGADPNRPNLNYRTPLDFAIKSGWLAGAERLIRAGCDSNYRDKDGFSPFYFAAKCVQDVKQRHKLLSLMLACGADLDLEYWATDDAPELLTGIDNATLSWLGSVRRHRPFSLSWLCRTSIRGGFGSSADTQIGGLSSVLPDSVLRFMLLKQ